MIYAKYYNVFNVYKLKTFPVNRLKIHLLKLIRPPLQYNIWDKKKQEYQGGYEDA